jgi:hypothetical protein
VLVVVTTGIDIQDDDASVRIMPNPASGEFNIVFGNPVSGQVAVRVTDVSGRVVYNDRFENPGTSPIHIAASDLADGVYMVSIVTGETVLNRKLLIVR